MQVMREKPTQRELVQSVNNHLHSFSYLLPRQMQNKRKCSWSFRVYMIYKKQRWELIYLITIAFEFMITQICKNEWSCKVSTWVFKFFHDPWLSWTGNYPLDGASNVQKGTRHYLSSKRRAAAPFGRGEMFEGRRPAWVAAWWRE